MSYAMFCADNTCIIIIFIERFVEEWLKRLILDSMIGILYLVFQIVLSLLFYKS